ncbi:TPA: hypothetical protein L3876_006610 [Pseudomonas aeruginosa]|nr:hypothetical protein [Pseudomonas aeruginosa]
MRRKAKMVLGVGRNDAAGSVFEYEIVGGRKRVKWACPAYRAWKNMLTRCYSQIELARHPTYIGCTVTPAWLSFSAFVSWMELQDHEGKQLDKDILSPGNKVYSPDTCVFVSSQMNKFLTDSSSSRGEWPAGVYLEGRSGRFKAQCNNPFTGVRENLGYFTCPIAAHEAWRARKHLHACTYADQQTDPRIAQALCSRYT